MLSGYGKIENGDIKLANSQEKLEWLERNRNYKGDIFYRINKTTKERTQDQNSALHLWLTKKAEQCREAGLTRQKILAKTIELEVNEHFMKEIWRDVQEAMFKNGKSTKNLEKNGQIDEIVEHLNRFFAEKFNLPGTEFPNDPNKIRN
jgi:hypothetical protein